MIDVNKHSWITYGAYGLCHAGAVYIGYALYLDTHSVATFWPASGVFVGALLILRKDHWPGIIAAAVFAQLLVDIGIFNRPLATQLVYAAISCFEAIVIAYFARRITRKRGFGMNDIFRSMLTIGVPVIIVGTAVTAIFGAWLVVAIGPGVDFLNTWQIWWFSDLLGLMVIGPTIVAAARVLRPGTSDNRRRGAELVVLVIVGVVTAIVSLAASPGQIASILQAPYLVFPLLVWAALRFDPVIPLSYVSIVTLIAVFGLVQGVGPFANVPAAGSSQVFALQTFLASFALFGMTLAFAIETARHREYSLHAFFTHSPHEMNIKDSLGRYEFINKRVEETYGVSNSEVVGRDTMFLYDREFVEGVYAGHRGGKEIAESVAVHDKEVFDTLGVVAREHSSVLGDRVVSDLAVKFPIFGTDGSFTAIGTISTDITELKEAQYRLQKYQDELRQLAAEVSQAAERERRRISNELHDSTAQNLVAIMMKLRMLSEHTNLDQKSSAELRETQDLVDLCIDETRSLIFELSPPSLYELGLVPAIQWLAERFQTKHQVDCDVRVGAQFKALDSELEIALYQVTRELLTNIAKHAKASYVSIDIEQIDEKLMICVEDDGIGYDITESAQTELSGFGLFSIRERLRIFDAELQIQSSSKGTRVEITVSQQPPDKAIEPPL